MERQSLSQNGRIDQDQIEVMHTIYANLDSPLHVCLSMHLLRCSWNYLHVHGLPEFLLKSASNTGPSSPLCLARLHRKLGGEASRCTQAPLAETWARARAQRAYIILYYTRLYYIILYYTILYYTILYYTIIYYTILYYTILYYTILYYTILYYTVLYCTVLYCTTLHYTILCYAILYCTVLYYDMLYYTILYYTIP